MWAFAFWSDFKQKRLLPHVKGSLWTQVEIGINRTKWLPRDMHKKDNFLHLILKLLGICEPGTDLDFGNNYDHNVPKGFIPSISPYLQKKINTLIIQST